MKLNQALSILKTRKLTGEPKLCILACGCQPLHLGTFLHACLVQRFPEDRCEITTGLYGDLLNNLERAAKSAATAAAVVLEWSDVDPRLGLRSTGGWTKASRLDIVATSRERLSQFAKVTEKLTARVPVAIVPPTLALPPIDTTAGAQAGELELELELQLASCLVQLGQIPGVRIVPRSRISMGPPLDAKLELVAGFPYTVPHASALAQACVEALFPQPVKKGLITDLDGTLWLGIVGEVGVDNICWTQEHHAQVFGLYQQMLGHLAECGVLLAVCSKNEAAVVEAALQRKDLLLDAEALFPVCAGWGTKSASVREVLRVWNIGEDAVVFVDDSPMELSEVQQAFPGITCLQFPVNDPGGVWNLLVRLRDLFGKPFVTEEDGLRRTSIRAGAWTRDAEEQSSSPEFLRSLQGKVKIDYSKNPSDNRALELINKTNQFNLNGLRMSEGEWRACLQDDENIIAVVSYQDKFGPLGRIATLIGKRAGQRVEVSHWVMSCRAFSRRLEYHTLESLFRHSDAEEIEFAFRATERNQPLQEFFQQIGVSKNGSGRWRLSRSQFLWQADKLPHQASEIPA